RMIVVSHRGPYRFTARDDGRFDATRGAGGVVSALVPLLLNEDHPSDLGDGRDTTWVAAAASDDDRAAGRAGLAPVDPCSRRLLDLPGDEHRRHYDVVSNGVLWFLHHGMFDLVRQPVFGDRFREAWDSYVRVNRAFADAVLDACDGDEVVLVQDYQLS